jgi:hypothetical protein
MSKFFMNKTVFALIAIIVSVLLANSEAAAQKQQREHIQATAMGTSTQLGRVISIDMIMNEFSTASDKAALIEAFQAKGSEGLANALNKMNSKGRIRITGTLGYDVNYIRSFNMPDGSRLIRFVTDRPIVFGELWASTRSLDYQISIGEIIIKEKGKGKSSGKLYPASLVRLNDKNEIEIETLNNPWNLVNIKLSH